MNKGEKNFEIRLYELLGVKIFRKMVFGLRDILAFPLVFKMEKEERKKFLNTPSNYNMKIGHGLQDLRNFKGALLFNSAIHMFVLITCLPNFLKVIGAVSIPISLSSALTNVICVGISIYCLMLQRYNWVRINKVIKKYKPREDKQKEEIKEELIHEDSLIDEHTYIISNNKNKEKEMTIEQLLKNATLSQLKEYRKYLRYYKNINETINQIQYLAEQEEQIEVKLSISDEKTLKLKLKPKSDNESA